MKTDANTAAASFYAACSAVALPYGYRVNEAGHFVTPAGTVSRVQIKNSRRSRIRIEADGRLLFTGTGPASVGEFVERFWYAQKMRSQ